MYLNAKMKPVETGPGIRGDGGNSRVGELKYDTFDSLQETL
jgi:hypothetical protein